MLSQKKISSNIGFVAIFPFAPLLPSMAAILVLSRQQPILPTPQPPPQEAGTLWLIPVTGMEIQRYCS